MDFYFLRQDTADIIELKKMFWLKIQFHVQMFQKLKVTKSINCLTFLSQKTFYISSYSNANFLSCNEKVVQVNRNQEKRLFLQFISHLANDRFRALNRCQTGCSHLSVVIFCLVLIYFYTFVRFRQYLNKLYMMYRECAFLFQRLKI